MKKSIILLLAILIFISVPVNAVIGQGTTTHFTDVKETDWFYKDVMELIRRGLISGYPDKTFRPNAQIRVNEFTKILVSTIDNNIKTSPNAHWAEGYINKAKELGIIKNGEFSDYNRYITRGEMARMIVRTAELNGETQYNKLENFKYIIPDYSSIDPSLQEYVIKAYSKGIISGYKDKTFSANESATRAQACAMIIKLIDESKRPEVDATVVPRFKIVNNATIGHMKHWVAVIQDTSIPFDVINEYVWQYSKPECLTHPINDFKQVFPDGKWGGGYTYIYDPNKYMFISYSIDSELAEESYYSPFTPKNIPYYHFYKNSNIYYLKPVHLKEGMDISFKIRLRKVKPEVLPKEQAEKMEWWEVRKYVETLKDSDFDYYTIILKGKLPPFEPQNDEQKLEYLQYVK